MSEREWIFEIGDYVNLSGEGEYMFEVSGVIHDSKRLFVSGSIGEVEVPFSRVVKQFREVHDTPSTHLAARHPRQEGGVMNARELLKEARAELAKVHDHLMELTAKLPMQYFGLVDGNIIQAEDCLIDQIDAYLAAPIESAMEMIGEIRADNPVDNGEFIEHNWTLSDSDAAALIESGRGDGAMLDEVRQRMGI